MPQFNVDGSPVLLSDLENGVAIRAQVRAFNEAGNGPWTEWVTVTPTVTSPPTVSVTPELQSVPEGQSATLTATATGTAPLTYQWQVETEDVVVPPPGDIYSDATGTQASPAHRLWMSVGGNTHPEYGTYKNVAGITNYTTATLAWAQIVVDSGMKHVRMMPENENSWLIEWFGQRGVMTLASIGHGSHGTPSAITTWWNDRKQTVIDNAQYIRCILGPNEVDNSSTNGSTSNMANTMQTLWNLVRAEPALNNIPVATISMTWPNGKNEATIAALGDVGPYAQVVDCHPYPGEATPDSSRITDDLAAMRAIMDSRDWSWEATDWDYLENPASAITSETGHHNATLSKNWKLDDHATMPRDVSATHFPRFFVYYDQQGVACTTLYEVINQADNGETRTDTKEYAFGALADHQLGLKPGYHAIKNFQALIADPDAEPFVPGKLNYTLSGGNSATRHYLYQRSDSTFVLFVWQNRLMWTYNTYANNADVNVTLTLNASAAQVQTAVPYRRGMSGTSTILGTATSRTAGQGFSFPSNDYVTAVLITPTGA